MDCIPQGYSVHVILQARTLDWVDNSLLYSILKYKFKTQWDITSPSFGCFYKNKLYIPCGSVSKIFPCKAGDLGSIPGLERSLGEGKGYPVQYSGLENSMECIVLGVAKSWTRLSNFHFISLHKNKANLKTMCYGAFGDIRTLAHYWYSCKMMQPLWKT